MKIQASTIVGFGTIILLAYKGIAATYIFQNALALPEEASGKVIAIYSHGRNIYVTADQWARLYGWHWINLLLIAVICLFVMLKIRGKDKDSS